MKGSKIVVQLRVPKFVKDLVLKYEKESVLHWERNTLNRFTKTMVIGTCSFGFLVGGYIGGSNSCHKSEVPNDIMIGATIGTGLGLFGGMLWPLLPYVPIPYVGYKVVKSLVDRERKYELKT